ncbi:MAG: hypothetical protein WB699_10420 [Bacteroidota bacterium]
MTSSVSLRPSTAVPYAALVSQFHAEPHGKLYCLHGDALAFRVALSAASQAILRGMTVALVDGANRFDAYFIAEFARHVEMRGGPPPGELLNRIFVSRAFTCYQMEAVVTERLPKFLDRTGARVAVLFGPLDTFYDDQAPFFEVKAGVGRMIEALQRLREHQIGVLVASQDVRLASGERSSLFPRFAAAMDGVYTVEQQEGKLLMHAQAAPVMKPPRRVNNHTPLRIHERSTGKL